MSKLLELFLCLAASYVVFSWIEYSGHRWLLHKMRMANRLGSQYLQHMCTNHMKLHHGKGYEHKHHQKDDDPLQLTVVGMLVGFVGTLPLYLVYPFGAKVLVVVGILYALVMYFVHLEMHLRKGWFYAKTPVFRYLERRHRLHHLHPNANYNVLLPLFDWLFGTGVKITVSEAELGESAAY